MIKAINSVVQNATSAGVSHDVKTLVNGVLCMSSLLENTPLSIEQAEIVQLLRKSASELNSMMTKVLEQTNPNQHSVVYNAESFHFVEEVKYIFDTFKLTIMDKPIKAQLVMDKAVPSTVRGNKSALNRILNNLLHNAGKFTENGSIELHIKNKRVGIGNPILCFEITDTGIGIADENVMNIFNRFTKFNSEGYGIGLATAKELVEQANGTIKVKSQVGIGTTFSVTLPFEATHFAAVKKSIPLSIKSLKGKKVLIADDDIVYKKYLTTILKQYQAHITLANTGKETLQLVDNQHFDLIMVDLNLPDIDGYNTVFNIRKKIGLNAYTAIVGMSASDADRQKVAACGMDDVLPKPLNTEGLTLRLQKVLEHKKSVKKQISKVENREISPLKFNKKLDTKHLEALYGDDLEHAFLIFEAFLSESLPQFYAIYDALETKNFKEIKALAHRFKIAFSMVGLTNIEKHLTHLERHIFNYSPLQITEILNDIADNLRTAKPILEKELSKMKCQYQSKAA